MLKQGLVVLAAAFAASGCVVVSSERVTRDYDIAGFDSVSASQGVNVVLRQGPFAVSADGPEDRVERLTIERDGSTLKLGQKPTTAWFGSTWNSRTVITVAAPQYVSVTASGGADVDAEGLRQDTLRVKASGGADINLHSPVIGALELVASGGADINAISIDGNIITADSSGGADIRLTGRCNSITAEASGGADIKGSGLTCESAVVTASGGGDADITATAMANGRASSGGDVRFHGNPASFQKEESGGGDVTAGR
jgi:hypothetical protein